MSNAVAIVRRQAEVALVAAALYLLQSTNCKPELARAVLLAAAATSPDELMQRAARCAANDASAVKDFARAALRLVDRVLAASARMQFPTLVKPPSAILDPRSHFPGGVHVDTAALVPIVVFLVDRHERSLAATARTLGINKEDLDAWMRRLPMRWDLFCAINDRIREYLTHLRRLTGSTSRRFRPLTLGAPVDARPSNRLISRAPVDASSPTTPPRRPHLTRHKSSHPRPKKHPRDAQETITSNLAHPQHEYDDELQDDRDTMADPSVPVGECQALLADECRCTVCGVSCDRPGPLRRLTCSTCHVVVHTGCYGISESLTPDWRCAPCAATTTANVAWAGTSECALCLQPRLGLASIPCKRDGDGNSVAPTAWSHVICALAAKGLRWTDSRALVGLVVPTRSTRPSGHGKAEVRCDGFADHP